MGGKYMPIFKSPYSNSANAYPSIQSTGLAWDSRELEWAAKVAEQAKAEEQSIKSKIGRMKMLAMRLRAELTKLPYEFIDTHLSGDKVFVFVVQDNQAVTIEDSTALFPSDTLITQLRLLEK